MDIIIIIIIVVITISIISGVVNSKAKEDRRYEMSKRIRSNPDFMITQQIMDKDAKNGIAIDEKKNKICFIKTNPYFGKDFNKVDKFSAVKYSANRNKQFIRKYYSNKNIISVEIIQNGQSVSKTSRSSQFGGAVLGGLALGTAGAIIGGLSGTKVNSEIISSIRLRILINDIKNPIYTFDFLNEETEKSGFYYQDAIEKANHWYSLVKVLIKRAELENNASSNAEKSITEEKLSGSVFIANELKKLSELKNEGILTNEEFQKQKNKLLNQ